MAHFVLDASMAIALLLDEDSAAGADHPVDLPAVAPLLWPLEVGNVLLLSFRCKRLSAKGLQQALADAARFDVTLDGTAAQAAFTALVALAERHRLTLYDAAYLELALHRRLPLSTLDRDLRKAASDAGLAVLPA